MNTKTSNMLADFVVNVLNDANQHDNAIVYDDAYFLGAHNERVEFNRNHREQYNKLLSFCIANNLTVVSTHPATLTTVIRIDDL